MVYGTETLEENLDFIAESLGVTRPSLSRELINMKEIGLIDYSRSYIEILNLEEIENILFE